MSKKTLTKGMVNALGEAISRSLGKSSAYPSPRTDARQRLVGLGLLVEAESGLLEITPAGVDALREVPGDVDAGLAALVARWDAEAKAKPIVERIKEINPHAFDRLCRLKDWPLSSTLRSPSGFGWSSHRNRPDRLLEICLDSIGQARIALPSAILKLRCQLTELEDLMDGVKKIHEELRSLGVKEELSPLLCVEVCDE
jgi:hypothetical protein